MNTESETYRRSSAGYKIFESGSHRGKLYVFRILHNLEEYLDILFIMRHSIYIRYVSFLCLKYSVQARFQHELWKTN